MKTRRTYLLRWTLVVFFIFCNITISYAQKYVGVFLEASDDLEIFTEELSVVKQNNISFVILDHPLNDDQIDRLDQFELYFFINLNNSFISAKEFENNSDKFIGNIKENYIRYHESSSFFSSVIAFSHSSIDKKEYWDKRLPGLNDSSLVQAYEFKKDSIKSITHDYHGQKVIKVFEASEATEKSIHNFKYELEQADQLVVVSNEWLKSSIEKFPNLKKAFLEDGEIDSALIPLPKIPNQLPVIHWSIVVLIGLWISLAINVATNPTYLETIPRYFTAHRFYVDDIMSYRERSSGSAVFLLFQHAIFGGLVSYILAKIFISDTGLEALYFHLPYLAIMGKNYFSLFVLTSVLVLIVELIALIWLYFPNKEMSHFNQALNLFTWIFHLDFILVTLMITVYFSGWNTSFLASILAITYVLIWFSSFNITALDASKRLGMKRNSYLLKTIGLHTLVSCALVILLVSFDGWWDVLKLAVSV